MGLSLRGVIRCGHCGKPRGIRHTCVRRIGRKSRAHKLQNPVTWTCPACGKPRGVKHTCSVRTDFKARRRQQATRRRQADRKRKKAAARQRQKERRQRSAAERRERARQQKRKGRKPASSRPRGESHEPGSCGDRECPNYRCRIYWRGMDDCPGPHEGE